MGNLLYYMSAAFSMSSLRRFSIYIKSMLSMGIQSFICAFHCWYLHSLRREAINGIGTKYLGEGETVSALFDK